ANTMAKLAGGLSDNLLACVLRACDSTNQSLLCLPVLNTFMWTHPFTKRHLDTLTGFLGYSVIEPIYNKLACGDTGVSIMYGACKQWQKWTQFLRSSAVHSM
ncbi:flavoprotein, partial [Cladochytrium replicatum]